MAYRQITDTNPADERAFTVYTLRLPLTLANEIRAAAERRFEPASVLVRRLVSAGLRAEAQAAGGHDGR